MELSLETGWELLSEPHRRFAPAEHGAAHARRGLRQALQQAGRGLEHRARDAHVRAQRRAHTPALVPAIKRLAHHACTRQSSWEYACKQSHMLCKKMVW